MDEAHPVRRVAGVHDVRFSGLSDLLLFANGSSVIDIGMNRGHVAYDFYLNRARVVHGCDIDGASVQVARHWFSELPHVQSQFEVVDLEKGPKSLDPFGPEGYDIVLFIGVYHKLKRVMAPDDLSNLVFHIGTRAIKFLGWNGYAEDVPAMDKALEQSKLTRLHTSELELSGRVAAIWKRRQ